MQPVPSQTLRVEQVVASVGSLEAEDLHVAEVAARVATDQRASLTLVYALTPVGFMTAGTQGLAQQEEYELAHRRLAEIAKSVGSSSLDPTLAIREGRMRYVLEAVAEERSADVLVARARRVKAWRSRFANRSLRRLAGALACPVLGVHSGEGLPVGSGLRLLVPARSAASALRVAGEAARLLEPTSQDTRIRLVQLVPELETWPKSLGHEAPEVDHERERLGAERDLGTVAEMLSERGLDASTVVREGAAVAIAQAERRAFGADVIAVRGDVWERSRVFQETPLAALLARARCPVLAV